MSDPDRKLMDRHGPLAWGITASITFLSGLGIVFRPESTGEIIMASVAALAGMHAYRERSRAQREAAGNGK